MPRMSRPTGLSSASCSSNLRTHFVRYLTLEVFTPSPQPAAAGISITRGIHRFSTSPEAQTLLHPSYRSSRIALCHYSYLTSITREARERSISSEIGRLTDKRLSYLGRGGRGQSPATTAGRALPPSRRVRALPSRAPESVRR